MAASGKSHARSLSFPSRSHPSTAAVEQELNKLRTILFDHSSASTSSCASIHASLSGLVDLHACTHGLLATAATRQVLSLNHSRNHIDELLDQSLRILDACNATRDLVSQTKEHVRSLISASRRRNTDSSAVQPFSDYLSFRRSVKREATRLVASMKKTEHKIATHADEHGDHHLWAVIQALREVNAINGLVLGSLLSWLSASKTKQSKWGVVSRLMKKRMVVCAEKEEIGSVDDVVCEYIGCCVEKAEAERKQRAATNLEALEIGLEGFESNLECVFRRLITNRASLLNIISQ